MGQRAAEAVRLTFGLGLMSLVAFAAPAGAQDYSACAKFQNPFAYNQCLANHGPPAHVTLPIATPANADKPWAMRHAAAAPRAGAAIRFSRRRGRMTAEFTISDTPAAPRRRRAIQ